MEERVDDVTKAWWKQHRCRDTKTEAPRFRPHLSASSGSSYMEVDRWMSIVIPRQPLPILDGRRNQAFTMRCLATAGMSFVVDGRNWKRMGLAGRPCVLCGRPETANTLTHVLGDCETMDETRRTAWTACTELTSHKAVSEDEATEDMDMKSSLEHALTPTTTTTRTAQEQTEDHRGLHTATQVGGQDGTGTGEDTAQRALRRAAAVEDWVRITLGVPLKAAEATTTSGPRDGPVPPTREAAARAGSSNWRDTWYSNTARRKGGAAADFRKQLLRHTAPLVVEALTAVQQAVWAMEGASVPERERRRRKKLEEERRAAERERERRATATMARTLRAWLHRAQHPGQQAQDD